MAPQEIASEVAHSKRNMRIWKQNVHIEIAAHQDQKALRWVFLELGSQKWQVPNNSCSLGVGNGLGIDCSPVCSICALRNHERRGGEDCQGDHKLRAAKTQQLH
ncbi:hypothetical protein PoB_007112700 [Plakobranchus ocellatus]|uniref:Uncharacterized protein n=1 Tax=Plakobranchus ocellatus TaxID=259542 RepID=A0AAV4DK14_9GAST|nr:hypothetical protein PoB_007112700 [Plakobranchus ocellatus]